MTDVSSPISGRVLALHVNAGVAVQAGEPLCTLEAMKMEIPIEAEGDGVVAEWLIDVGDEIAEGDVVVRLHAG